MRAPLIALALLALAPPSWAAGPIEPAELPKGAAVRYEDLATVFAAKCAVCHAGKELQGGYDMGSYAGVMKGGKRGAKVVVAGQPEASFLYTSSSHRVKPIMPPKSEDNALTPEEVGQLKRWIESGAKGPTTPASVAVKPAVAVGVALVTPVHAVAVRPDALAVAAGRGNQLLNVDAKTGEPGKSFVDPELKTPQGQPLAAAHRSLVESLAYRPDGKQLASGSFREVTLWDAATGAVQQRLAGFQDRVVALAYSPDGKFLATGGGVPTQDGELKLLDAATGKVVWDKPGAHSDTVFGVAFSPDGKLLATAGADKFVRVFDAATGKPVKTFEGHTHHVMDVGWATPTRLVSAGADNLIKVWDYEKGEKLKDIGGHSKQVTRLATLSKSPQFYTASGDATARQWSAEGYNQVRSLAEAKDFLYAVAASPDGKLIATGGEEGVVRLYDGATGKLIKK